MLSTKLESTLKTTKWWMTAKLKRSKAQPSLLLYLKLKQKSLQLKRKKIHHEKVFVRWNRKKIIFVLLTSTARRKGDFDLITNFQSNKIAKVNNKVIGRSFESVSASPRLKFNGYISKY